jgi:hypothetical protein
VARIGVDTRRGESSLYKQHCREDEQDSLHGWRLEWPKSQQAPLESHRLFLNLSYPQSKSENRQARGWVVGTGERRENEAPPRAPLPIIPSASCSE